MYNMTVCIQLLYLLILLVLIRTKVISDTIPHTIDSP